MLNNLVKDMKRLQDKKNAKLLQRYFKTGKGEYGEGDIFIGLRVPQIRQLVKKYWNLNFSDIQKLLNSKIHEQRCVGFLILVEQFQKGDDKQKRLVFNFYLKNARRANNWDLVDLSSHKIVGAYLLDKKRDVLYKLAKSKNLWEKRISIVSTFAFIAQNELDDSLKLAKILLGDSHDLIHKAVGWVLREIGKKNEKLLENFLKKNYDKITRTTLRYAIEKFEEGKRKKWLRGEHENQ